MTKITDNDTTETPSTKPVPRMLGPFYDYSDVIGYVEDKYKIDTRDYAGRYRQEKRDDSIPHQDFWGWYTDNHDVDNGCLDTLPIKPDDMYPSWVNEIITLIGKEFTPADDPGAETIDVWIEW